MKVVCILEAFDKFESVAGRRFCYNLQMSVGHFYLDNSPRTYPPHPPGISPPGHFPPFLHGVGHFPLPPCTTIRQSIKRSTATEN